MTTLKKAILVLTAAASALTLSSASLAQDGPGPRGRGGAAADGPGPGGRGDPAMREQRLHQRLNITAGQEAAFKAFMAATAPPANPPQRPDPQAMRSMPTPQRLDQQIAQERQRLAQLEQRAAATKRFYGVLSAEQKKTFDETPQLAMGPRGGGRGQDGPGGGRRGPGGRGGPGGAGPAQGYN